MRRRTTLLGAQECNGQRAVLSGTFSAPAGDAGSSDHRGPGAGSGYFGIQDRQGRARRQYAFLLCRHRQCAIPQARRAGRPTDAAGGAEALVQGNLEVRLPGAGRRQGSGVRRDHGRARDQGAARQQGISRRQGASAIRSDGMIDSRAVVSPQAHIAADVQIGPFSVVGADVVIGSGTWIGPHAVINGPTHIGRNNKIFQFASLGDAPQDKKYNGEPTRLEIGDRNVFRESVTVNRGTIHDKGVTRIGNDNLLMAYSHVAHDCWLGDQIVMANCATLGGHVELGDWVIMGGLSAVHQYTKVGAHCFIAHNAAVTRDVPPYVMAVGRPAVPHSVNSEGLKRRGFSAEQILNIRGAYRVLYRSGLKLKAAMEELEKMAAVHAEVRPFVEFIARSERSIVR